MDPRRRIVGHSPDAPCVQCVHQRCLHHVLDEVEVPPAENAGEHGHQPPCLMAEEMLDERGDWCWFRLMHDLFFRRPGTRPNEAIRTSTAIPHGARGYSAKLRLFGHLLFAVSTSFSIFSSSALGSSLPAATTAAIFVVFRISSSGFASSSTRSAILPCSTVPSFFS